MHLGMLLNSYLYLKKLRQNLSSFGQKFTFIKKPTQSNFVANNIAKIQAYEELPTS
jgi:hypothetical protein